MLFIYLLEDHPSYADRVEYLLRKIQQRGHTLCTSIFTIGEVLSGFYKRGAFEAAAEVRNWFRQPNVELLPFDNATADRYAQIRARNAVTPADSIHLASAAEAGVQLFITNDRQLAKLNIDQIDFIAGLDVNLY
jgi:predicted nucleic acid-binding protein